MKKTETDDSPYLWDRSGEPDPEVVRLETLLGQLRQHGTPPALPDRPRRGLRVSTWTMGVLSAAAGGLLISRRGGRIDGWRSARDWRMARDRRELARPHCGRSDRPCGRRTEYAPAAHGS